MLAHMRIRNLGVIEDASVDFSPGLNVLTGETGAGKTMVVSGLGLLLGARGDAGMVRAGADAAIVEGVVEVVPDHPARARVDDAGGEATGELLLTRSVTAQGRSRAHVGGRQAPIGVLAELGELLVAVHGQADQWRLRRADQHLSLLDDVGDGPHRLALEGYARAYDRHRALAGEHERLRALHRDAHVEAEVLRRGLEEIERVDPRPGEDDELRVQEERLAHADALRAAAGLAHALVSGGDDADGAADCGMLDRIGSARAALSGVSVHDPQLADLEHRLAELGYLAADVGAELAAYLDGVDADPRRLGAVQDRRAQLTRLQRAYGPTASAVLEWARCGALRLAELEGAHDRAEEITAELAVARVALAAAAAELSARRQASAARLGERVTGELRHLAMGGAVVEVAVQRQLEPGGLMLPGQGDPVRYTRHGIDDVDIRLAASRGAPARSVAKAASGGELSRVMLALEVVAGDTQRAGGEAVPTFVFDEVDAGVGGRAALDLGARLAALAEHAQVLVVTHLPQVAAYADTHFAVHKSDDGQVTASDIEAVTGSERLAELARMMAGGGSDVALEHAAELLADAQRRRQARAG